MFADFGSFLVASSIIFATIIAINDLDKCVDNNKRIWVIKVEAFFEASPRFIRRKAYFQFIGSPQ